jgi:hypothetical protein
MEEVPVFGVPIWMSIVEAMARTSREVGPVYDEHRTHDRGEATPRAGTPTVPLIVTTGGRNR